MGEMESRDERKRSEFVDPGCQPLHLNVVWGDPLFVQHEEGDACRVSEFNTSSSTSTT
jgi:hypothetical protein